MSVPQLAAGPYSEYSRRLRALHAFIREGQGDSDEADSLRDEMDDDYSRLTSEEIGTLEILSADLNWFAGIDHLRDWKLTGVELRQQLMLASADEEWISLRSLLGSNANVLGESDGLLFRSIYWLGSGDVDSSLFFLEALGGRLEAMSLDIAAKRSLLKGWVKARGFEDRAIFEQAGEFDELADWAMRMVGRALDETRNLIAMVKAFGVRKDEHGPVVREWSLLKQQFSRVEACTWATPSQAA